MNTLAEFNNALNISKTKDRNYVQRWICMAQAEQQVFSGQLNRSEFQPQVDACSPPLVQFVNSNQRRAKGQPKPIDETGDPSRASEVFSNSFTVFPNPASNELTVGYTIEESSDAKFEIQDVNGRVVDVYALPSSEHTMSITLDLTPGIYMYRIVTNNTISKADKLVIIRN